MHEKHVFNWLDLFGIDPHGVGHVVVTAVLCGLVLIFAALATLKLKAAERAPDQGFIPEDRLTLRNVFEILFEKVYGLAESVMGPDVTVKYFPVVAALFFFILVCNLIGLVPGFLPPTENLNTTFAIAIFVFIYYNWVGIKENGFGYLKHFAGPIAWLAPLMFGIELVSHVFRPLSLALRLRGNIMGDHIVMGIFTDLTPYLVPLIFYGLGLFVALVQTFVFCLMTMIYISLSASHDH